MKFTELDLHPQILRGLKEMSHEDLTPIQEATIPHILAGKDVMGLAETGSGKTGACGIPLVQMSDPDVRAIQAMILVPTRELAQQYVAEIASIARYTRVAPFAMFGGFDMDIQRAKLKDGVQILVATPGRLIDYLWNNVMPLDQVRTIVLDEADEMLKMGFVENVDFIMSCLMHEHQTLMFSATMPKEVERLSRSYLKDPVRSELIKGQASPQSLNHHFQVVRNNDRLKMLEAYLKDEKIGQGIIFCNSRSNGSRLIRELKNIVPSVDYIHGGLEQSQRTSIFNKFRRKEIHLLVATDVAGRGLDFTHVTHVINYEFPNSSESYTHRTGRTGRMGREGTALTFVTDRDLKTLKRLLQDKDLDPKWRGKAPDLNQVSTHQSSRNPQGNRNFRKKRSS
ncbi:MAG: ATP-dependent RNA helicase DeaD [Candidatus Latescibacterota bacterium]|jgi:ATP-dependent RNA helicase DeaD